VTDSEEFLEWMSEGHRRGWVSLPVCSTHDGIPQTPEEEHEWEEGYDPCHTVLRIWFDD
jgi:hypothetical protein